MKGIVRPTLYQNLFFLFFFCRRILSAHFFHRVASGSTPSSTATACGPYLLSGSATLIGTLRWVGEWAGRYPTFSITVTAITVSRWMYLVKMDLFLSDRSAGELHQAGYLAHWSMFMPGRSSVYGRFGGVRSSGWCLCVLVCLETLDRYFYSDSHQIRPNVILPFSVAAGLQEHQQPRQLSYVILVYT